MAQARSRVEVRTTGEVQASDPGAALVWRETSLRTVLTFETTSELLDRLDRRAAR
jgi:hypothetical protein